MHSTWEFKRHRPGRRLTIGIAASFAAHLALVLAFRADSLKQMLVKVPEPAQALLVWIKPKPPAPKPEPKQMAEAAKPVKRPKTTTARAPQPSSEPVDRETDAPEAVIALDPTPQNDPFYVQPAPENKPFDMAAARAAARQVAVTADPARAGLAVGQFDKERNRVKPDDVVARKIAQAKRPHCKDGIPGGLLAPLLLLMDKKDHGCKW